jgi:hypothetical protein
MAAFLPWFCLILIAGRPVFVSSVRSESHRADGTPKVGLPGGA